MTVSRESDVVEKLAALQLSFKNSLPDKIAKIEQLREEYFHTDQSENSLTDLHIMAHSLAGSGGTFGAIAVSTAARELELKIKLLISESEQTSALTTEIQQQINTSIAQLNDACDNWQPTNIPYIKPVDKESNISDFIYLVDDDELLGEGLTVELEHADFRVKYFTNVKDFEEACKVEMPAAIIMDVVFSESDVAGADVIKRLKNKVDTFPPVLFISVRDDIEIKLAAARAGARRYFCKPLDTKKIIRTLEGLTARSEKNPYRVLIVDDEEPLLEYYSVILADAGMDVKTLSNPMLTLNEMTEFKPDIVVADVYMPECSGPELAQVIRQDDNWAMMPIMFLSSESNLNRQLDAMNLGGDDFLVKPVEGEHLVSAITARVKRGRWIKRLNSDLSTSLRESEYQTVTMNQHDIVSYTDVSGSIISVNDKFCEISGYSREELIGKNHRLLKSGYHSDSFYKELWEKVSAGNVWHGVVCNLNKNGDEYWLNYTIVPFLNEHGTPYKYVSACTDITTTRQNEERLNLSQQFANIGTWDWNIRTNEMYLSERVSHLFGYQRDVQVSTYDEFLNFIHTLDRVRVVEAIDSCIKQSTKFNIEYRVVWQDKSIHWVSASGNVVRSDDGSPLHMLGVVRDITKRVNAEIKQRETEDRFTFAVEGAGDGVWDWDMRTDVMQFSPLYMEMLGYADKELPEAVETWVKSVHPDDLPGVQNKLKDYLEGRNSAYVIELRLRCKDDSYKWILCRGKVVNRDDKDEPLRMIGIHSDISERKEVEQNLIVTREEADNANRAKSQFLSSMSHELRTPMNAIMGFSQLLKMETSPALTGYQLDNVNEIYTAGEHLMELINDVLDLAKIEGGHIDLTIESVVLAKIISESVQLIRPLAAKSNIEVTLTQDGSAISFDKLSIQNLSVLADYTRLKQVLLNLLSNAVKYNSKNGKIIIACDHLADNKIRISITDTGMGLTKEQQSQLFTAFNRLGADKTDIEGTGIGLVITKNIIELMNGNIGFESKPGVGSTFWVELPNDMTSSTEDVNKIDDSKNTSTLTSSNNKSNGHSVLYIEDNPANLRLVAQVLKRKENLHMWSAHEPLLGLELAEEHNPDLILLDINLPGMDGFEVLKHLRQREATSNTPVIAISANAMPKDIDKGLKAGFDDYITKPIDIRALLQAVDNKLDSQ